jgi:3-oxoacyl-[acyl-carrier protein] reductase
MDYHLQDKPAIVLAGTRGLGLAVARALAAEGCRVAVCSRSQTHASEAAATLASECGPDNVFAAAADVVQPDELTAFLDAAAERFGPPAILVTNAGGPPTGTFGSIDDPAWYDAFELTFMSAIRAIRHVLPAMTAAQWGRIVAVTSISVKQPLPNLMLSNALRAGLTGCLKTLAAEVASDGITVNCVCPGYTRTQRLEALAAQLAETQECGVDDIIANWTSTIPSGRLATPEEFASAVCYLCSEQAASITGASLWIDGGFYRGLL